MSVLGCYDIVRLFPNYQI